MRNTVMRTASTPGVQDALNVNILGKLRAYALMVQRIALVNFKEKGYFEPYQCI